MPYNIVLKAHIPIFKHKKLTSLQTLKKPRMHACMYGPVCSLQKAYMTSSLSEVSILLADEQPYQEEGKLGVGIF
jgi:hypothetical protein